MTERFYSNHCSKDWHGIRNTAIPTSIYLPSPSYSLPQLRTTMKRLMPLFLLLCLLIGSAVTAKDDAPINFQEITNETEWKSVLAQSQKKAQAIFVMVHTSWCGYCRKMEREVYTKTKVADYHNTYLINVRIDGESLFGIKFSEKHRVEAFPGLLFLNENESILQSIPGYLNAKDLLYYAEESVRINSVMMRW